MTQEQPQSHPPSPQKTRCLNCRVEILVPASYAHGDHVPCGTCGTQHRVVRGEGLRLVLADTGALREALRHANEQIERMEAELRAARGSFGIGANGIGLGLIYVLWQIVFKDVAWSNSLLLQAAAVALGSGGALEAANYLFLAKRRRIRHLGEELSAARTEMRTVQQRLRESSRV